MKALLLPLDSTYQNVLYARDELADEFAVDLNLTEQELRRLDFASFEEQGDRLYAEMFEGLELKENLTAEEQEDLKAVLMSALVNVYTNHSRQLMVTKESRTPLRELKLYIQGRSEGLPKYRIYSAHDTNIANWLY